MNQLLIHVHGFLSANDSDRVVALKDYVEVEGLDIEVISPRLPERPQAAVEMLQTTIENALPRRDSVALVGHSLGAYFCTYLATRYALRAALVNPVVRGYEIMCEFIGDCYNEHTGAHFEISGRDIEYLVGLYLAEIPDHSRFLVLQQLGDEITDPQETISYYSECELLLESGGCHDFTNFERHAGSVIEFLFAT